MIVNLISDQMKQIWINLELYFESYEFPNFKGFLKIFSSDFFKIFSKFGVIFSEILINFLRFF